MVRTFRVTVLASWLSASPGAILAGCKEPIATRPASSVAPSAAPSASTAPATPTPAASDDAVGGGTISPIGSATAATASGLQPRNDLPGLPNFAKVADGLYRGAQPSAEGFRTLTGMGVKTVVNLRWAHSDREMLAGTGLQYLHIRAKAWHPSLRCREGKRIVDAQG